MGVHEQYMLRCLNLALQGLGKVAPNPMVGCVIVHKGEIIGEGYHEVYGGPHAEVNAIASVKNKSLLVDSELYVNLEPCAHHGKTPPCSDLIIHHKIPRVFIGSNDPYPLVAGKGIAKMRSAGIDVTLEILKTESDFLNRRFLTFYSKHRPYIILKWAQSKDGFIAANEPKQVWLTNESSKKLVHKWRSEEQAIMIGTNTARIDNPELTVRHWQGKNPLRVVIDKELNLPPSLKMFDGSVPTLVFNALNQSATGNVEFIKIDFNSRTEEQILDALKSRNILSVIIEGGAHLLNSFIAKNLWDEARIFQSNALLQSGKQVKQLHGRLGNEENIDGDTLMTIYDNE